MPEIKKKNLLLSNNCKNIYVAAHTLKFFSNQFNPSSQDHVIRPAEAGNWQPKDAVVVPALVTPAPDLCDPSFVSPAAATDLWPWTFIFPHTAAQGVIDLLCWKVVYPAVLNLSEVQDLSSISAMHRKGF